MASSINASTSGAGGVITTADNTGILNLQSAGTTVAAVSSTGVAVTGTLSASGAITATGGIVVGAAAAPAFSVYLTGNQSVTNNVFTKVTFNTETFDTNNNFDSTTNYRFTPTVAGYYQINGTIMFGGVGMTLGGTYIYKNGAAYKNAAQVPSSTYYSGSTVADVIYFNGSTDYIELYGLITGTSGLLFFSQILYTFMSGALIRSA